MKGRESNVKVQGLQFEEEKFDSRSSLPKKIGFKNVTARRRSKRRVFKLKAKRHFYPWLNENVWR